MNVAVITLPGTAIWRFDEQHLMSPAMAAIGGWSILAPLPNVLKWKKPPFSFLCQLADGSYLFISHVFFLVADDAQPVELDSDKLNTLLDRYLTSLRVIAQQPELPRSLAAFNPPARVPKLPPCSLPALKAKGTVRKDFADSAITLQQLSDANDAVMSGNVPVHGELINDAAELYLSSNYRSSIIFSAMAIESCAGYVLDCEYESVRKTKAKSSAYRCLTIKVNNKQSVKKDPIYLALRSGTGEGGSHFLPLLHECPLYLQQRSLLLDDPRTYQRAHALYRTRNGLAHTGTTDAEKDGLLPISSKGALEAMETANAVLAWFGQRGTSIPTLKFVDAKF